MKFFQIFLLGYRHFLMHFSIYLTYLILSYFVFVLIIGVLDFEFRFDHSKFSLDSLATIKPSSIIYALEFWGFLYFLYLFNTAYITFVSFEKRSLNIFKKIFYFIKFCGFCSYRLIPTFFLKPIVFGIILLLPFLFLAVTAFFMDFYNIGKSTSVSIITLLSFPAFGLCGILLIYYYLRLALVEYSVLVNKNNFFEAYEISVTGVEGSKLAILASTIVNVGICIAICILELSMSNSPTSMISEVEPEELWELSTHVRLFTAFFYATLPLIPIWTIYIGNCLVFKSYTFKNDLGSAEKSWENLF